MRIEHALTADACPLDAMLLTYLDRLRSHGYLIIERLAPVDTIMRINEELGPWLEATPHGEGDFYGWRTTRVNAVLYKSRTSHALLIHPTIIALMDQILGDHCDGYRLNLAQAVRLSPGERQQVPHRDDEMWPCPKHGIEYMVNVMWALSDFTADNGATLVWPRSQYRLMSRAANPQEAIAAAMRAGSALIYLGSTTHCAGANQTPNSRTGLIFSYSLGWLRTYENAYLAYPPEIARRFDRPVRELIGYRLHRPNLGHYEGQDPSVALSPHSRTLPMMDALPPAIAQELAQYYASAA